MRTIIEFNETTADTIPCRSPWATPTLSMYQDLILKPEFAPRRYKFPTGSTWFRVVPALPNSDKDWMLGVHALQYAKGRHVHPKTVIPGAKSVFDHAYTWLKEHQNDDLYSKTNKEGCRLLADPLSLFWLLVEEDGKIVSRLLVESGYDGSRGGTAGLGHQIWQLTQERDEDGNLPGNPANPSLGAQICVEKKQSSGTRYASYSLRMGRVPAPISEMFAKMDDEEGAALTPLEQVVHLPDEEEEWKLLENVIPAETIGKIRDSLR